jgi:hypothetical protein
MWLLIYRRFRRWLCQVQLRPTTNCPTSVNQGLTLGLLNHWVMVVLRLPWRSMIALRELVYIVLYKGACLGRKRWLIVNSTNLRERMWYMLRWSLPRLRKLIKHHLCRVDHNRSLNLASVEARCVLSQVLASCECRSTSNSWVAVIVNKLLWKRGRWYRVNVWTWSFLV